MHKIKIESLIINVARSFIILSIFSIFFQGVYAASSNDACFGEGNCHNSYNLTPIDRPLYDSNPHSIIECVDCHENSISNDDINHGQFIRQLKGSKVKGSGPLLTQYYSENFSLCYYCHNETKVVGVPPGYIDSPNHYNSNISVLTIGTNFRNENINGHNDNSDVPTNIHWNHLDAFGSVFNDGAGMYDYDKDGIIRGTCFVCTPPYDSFQSCPACHNVHGTNYPKMTKNDLAIAYGYDGSGTYGYTVGGGNYSKAGGDLFCTASCHNSLGTDYKYYRTEINLFDDCISCHIDNVDNIDNIDNISLVNRTAFSVHRNINRSTGDGILDNADCGTCHYKGDMNRSNIWQCNDCHTGTGKIEAPMAPKITTHVSGVKITNYSCTDCHSKVVVDPGTGIANITSHYLKRPIVSSVNYCDYCHGPNPGSPFNATNKTIPEFKHNDPLWNGDSTCRTCHTNSSVTADPNATETSSFHDLTTELGDAYNGSTKADCILCHIQKDPQYVLAPDLTTSHPTVPGQVTTECDACHRSGSNSLPQQLHSVEPTGGGCVACHSNNTSRYYVNINLFGGHKNLNTSDGADIDNVTDADCKTCHFGAANITMSLNSGLGAANHSNTYLCDDCHTSGGNGTVKPQPADNSNPLIKNNLLHGKADCKWCHIAGDSLSKPLDASLRYHPNGLKGTATGTTCKSCHYDANLPDSPFYAPGEIHSSNVSCIGGCHDSNNHKVGYYPSTTFKPVLENLIITSPVLSGNFAQVQATLKDARINKYVQMAAAIYQVKDASGTIVIDWTNLTAKDGRFDSSTEIVNASINTSNLLGSYTVYINGMSSAPKTNIALPYYPFNGRWSGPKSIQFTVTPPKGYIIGTVKNNSGSIISGATVTTNTGVFAKSDMNGFYSLNLEIGTYQLVASKEPEYSINSSLSGITLQAFITTTQNITLALKPTGTISGKVTKE